MSAFPTSPVVRAQLAPRITVYSDDWRAIEQRAEVLEAQLDALRTRADVCRHTGLTWHAVRGDLSPAELDKVRELRRELSVLDRESRTLLLRENPAYRDFWFPNEGAPAEVGHADPLEDSDEEPETETDGCGMAM